MTAFLFGTVPRRADPRSKKIPYSLYSCTTTVLSILNHVTARDAMLDDASLLPPQSLVLKRTKRVR
jgi:hypothetical protein